MKTLSLSVPLFLLLAVSGASHLTAQEARPTGAQVYERGRAALSRGDLPEARRCFESLLKADPGFELGRIQLAQVALAEKEQAKIPRSLKVARSLKVNRIQWSGTTLDDAIATAAQQLEKAGGREKWTVNTSGTLPKGVADREVSMSVTGISFDQLFDAIGFAGGVRISYTQEGISVKENSSGNKGGWDAGDPKLPTMEAAARKVIISRILFSEATIMEALEYLQSKAGEVSGGGTTPVFTLRYDLSLKGSVTLDLRNVSLYDAVRSVCMMADIEETWFPWGAGIANRQPPTATPGPTRKEGVGK